MSRFDSKTKKILCLQIILPVLESGEYCTSGGQDRKVYLWNPFSNDPEALIKRTLTFLGN